MLKSVMKQNDMSSSEWKFPCNHSLDGELKVLMGVRDQIRPRVKEDLQN